MSLASTGSWLICLWKQTTPVTQTLPWWRHVSETRADSETLPIFCTRWKGLWEGTEGPKHCCNCLVFFIKAGAYCSISRPSFLIQLSWCYKKRFTLLHLFRWTDGALTLWNNASFFFFFLRSACCICVSPALVTLISFSGSCLCLSTDPVSSAHSPGLSMTQAKAHFVPQSHLVIFCAPPSSWPRCNPRWKGGIKTYILKGVQSH